MNKVKQRCENPSSSKFLYASNVMFNELKCIKLFLYALNSIPVVICFLPASDAIVKTICSLISFALTLIGEVSSQMISNYKEKAILEKQIYESEITGSTFSKIEYDRESTNEMQELAIRKGMPKLNRDQEKGKKAPIIDVPDEISDDYSYLYIARQSAAKTRFLLSREFYFYMALLIGVAVALVCSISLTQIQGTEETNGQFGFYYVICFWPLIVPLIRNCVSCTKGMKQCVKICADVDNFFADGDESIERLARFYYYVQNIEFEMLLVKPIIFIFIEKMYTRPLRILNSGVTTRFKDAINELKTKKYITQPKGKNLITKIDYSLDDLKEKERLARIKKKKEEERARMEKELKEVKSVAPKKEPLKKKESVMSKSTEVIDVPSKMNNKSNVKVVKKEDKNQVKKTSNKTSSKTPSKVSNKASSKTSKKK